MQISKQRITHTSLKEKGGADKMLLGGSGCLINSLCGSTFFRIFPQQIRDQTFRQLNLSKTRRPNLHPDPRGCISLQLSDACQSQHSCHFLINVANSSVILSVAMPTPQKIQNFMWWRDSPRSSNVELEALPGENTVALAVIAPAGYWRCGCWSGRQKWAWHLDWRHAFSPCVQDKARKHEQTGLYNMLLQNI